MAEKIKGDIIIDLTNKIIVFNKGNDSVLVRYHEREFEELLKPILTSYENMINYVEK